MFCFVLLYHIVNSSNFPTTYNRLQSTWNGPHSYIIDYYDYTFLDLPEILSLFLGYFIVHWLSTLVSLFKMILMCMNLYFHGSSCPTFFAAHKEKCNLCNGAQNQKKVPWDSSCTKKSPSPSSSSSFLFFISLLTTCCCWQTIQFGHFSLVKSFLLSKMKFDE